MAEKLIQWAEVYELIGGILSWSTAARLERLGRFPARRRISHRKAVWLQSEIEGWLLGTWTAPKPQEASCGTDTEN